MDDADLRVLRLHMQPVLSGDEVQSHTYETAARFYFAPHAGYCIIARHGEMCHQRSARLQTA